MLRKILFLISLVHIAVADSIFGAHNTVTLTHRAIRQYRNSTSSAGSESTIRQFTLSTTTKTTQTTDHKSTSEVAPTVLGVDTRVTVEPVSSVAMEPTADQSPDSTVSEESREEPATASNSSPTRPAFISSPATPTNTNRSPIIGMSRTTEDPETGQPRIPSLSSALASKSRLLSPSSAIVSTPKRTTQTLDHSSVSISESWPTSLSIVTQVTAAADPTSTVALSPTPDQSLGSIASETTKKEPATPEDSVSTPKIALESTSRTAGTPPTASEDLFTTQTKPTLPTSYSSPATPVSTNRSPSPAVFTTTEDRGTSRPLVPTPSLALATRSRPPSPSSTTISEDAEQTKPHVHASVSPISTLEDLSMLTSLIAATSNGHPKTTEPLLPTSSSTRAHTSSLPIPGSTPVTSSKQPASPVQSNTALSNSTPPAIDQQATASFRHSGSASQSPSGSASTYTVSNTASRTTSISAAADVFANKAHMLEIDDTSTSEMGSEPTRNATAAVSSDTRIPTTSEDTTLNHSATLDTSTEPTADSPRPSQLTTHAGSPTLPQATHSTGASRTGSTPDPSNDIFANSGGQQTVKQKITVAGAAIGAVSGSALLGAAMFVVSSRYGRRRRSRRASGTSSSQSSLEIRCAGLSDERLVHRNHM